MAASSAAFSTSLLLLFAAFCCLSLPLPTLTFTLRRTADSAPYISPTKRLMGIFRCNGWGPGCTQFDGQSNSQGSGKVGLNKDEHRVYQGGRGRQASSGGGGGGRGRGGSYGKFQPFFTLTSGGSWGPTGKRSMDWFPSQSSQVPHSYGAVDANFATSRLRALRDEVRALADLLEQLTAPDLRINEPVSVQEVNSV